MLTPGPLFQEWTAPEGVQSVFVSMQGGWGGGGGGTDSVFGKPAFLQANVSLTPPNPGGLAIFVPSGGGFSGMDTSGGSGGSQTGGAGGSGSLSGLGGGGGGGAAQVTAVYPSGEVFLLVAGGGGGAGGTRNGSGGAGGNAGGVGAALSPPPSGGLWPGNAGSAAPGDNGGGGGGGGTQSAQGIGGVGGSAEDFSGNGGGGGGGGGYGGGSGGQPGQASASPFSTAGAGGGGGGGSSYANPAYTTFAVAGQPQLSDPNVSMFDGLVMLNWVDILTPALRPLRWGRTTTQQLVAASFMPASPAPLRLTMTWSVSAGALPEGLTLSPSGVLSGKPIKAGPYSFVATVQGSTDPIYGQVDITSVITYSGTVCSRRCDGRR